MVTKKQCYPLGIALPVPFDIGLIRSQTLLKQKKDLVGVEPTRCPTIHKLLTALTIELQVLTHIISTFVISMQVK